MVRAVVRGFSSPDVELDSYSPEDPTFFSFVLEVRVGAHNSGGADLFALTVCSPDWLKTTVGDGARLLTHHLVVGEYSVDKICDTIRNRFERVWGDTWETVALRLGKFARWEFEG